MYVCIYIIRKYLLNFCRLFLFKKYPQVYPWQEFGRNLKNNHQKKTLSKSQSAFLPACLPV